MWHPLPPLLYLYDNGSADSMTNGQRHGIECSSWYNKWRWPSCSASSTLSVNHCGAVSWVCRQTTSPVSPLNFFPTLYVSFPLSSSCCWLCPESQNPNDFKSQSQFNFNGRWEWQKRGCLDIDQVKLQSQAIGRPPPSHPLSLRSTQP